MEEDGQQSTTLDSYSMNATEMTRASMTNIVRDEVGGGGRGGILLLTSDNKG